MEHPPPVAKHQLKKGRKGWKHLKKKRSSKLGTETWGTTGRPVSIMIRDRGYWTRNIRDQGVI
jgi:hypothetical protein